MIEIAFVFFILSLTCSISIILMYKCIEYQKECYIILYDEVMMKFLDLENKFKKESKFGLYNELVLLTEESKRLIAEHKSKMISLDIYLKNRKKN